MQVTPEIMVMARRDHYTPGRVRPIDTVIIHATGGTNSTDWLQWESNPPVSIHVLIKRDGTRIRMVLDSDTAWHAGYSQLQLAGGPKVNVNQRSLGIELENTNDGRQTYPEAQLHALGEALAQWDRRYPNLHWYLHRDVDSRKHDPAGLTLATVRRYYARFAN